MSEAGAGVDVFFWGPMNLLKCVYRWRKYVIEIILCYSGAGVYWDISRHSLTVSLIGS